MNQVVGEYIPPREGMDQRRSYGPGQGNGDMFGTEPTMPDPPGFGLGGYK